MATVSHAVAAGGTTFTLTPKIGGWRVRARYSGTLSASPSVSGWIDFTIDTATIRRSDDESDEGAPELCTSVGCHLPRRRPDGQLRRGRFGRTSARKAAVQEPVCPTQGPRDDGRRNRAAEDPFKSDLLGNLDAAVTALADNNPDEARAELDEFVKTLQKAPLQAEPTSAQRDRLITTAKKIRAQISP